MITISGVMRAIQKTENDRNAVRIYNATSRGSIFVRQTHGVWQNIAPGKSLPFYPGFAEITRDINSLKKDIQRVEVWCDHEVSTRGIYPVSWYRRTARRLVNYFRR